MIAPRTAVFQHRGASAGESDRDDLRDRFLAAAAIAGEETGGWLSIWRLVVAHPWYRRELSVAAAAAVRRVHGPDAWREDVEHDAMLLLAKSLRRNPSLGLDARRAETEFGGWLGRIVRNDCRAAVRRLRRLGRGGPLPEDAERILPAPSRELEVEAAVDVRLAISRLAEPARSVLQLVAGGLDLAEAAERLGLSYWQAWRAFRNGRERLAVILEPPWR